MIGAARHTDRGPTHRAIGRHVDTDQLDPLRRRSDGSGRTPCKQVGGQRGFRQHGRGTASRTSRVPMRAAPWGRSSAKVRPSRSRPPSKGPAPATGRPAPRRTHGRAPPSTPSGAASATPLKSPRRTCSGSLSAILRNSSGLSAGSWMPSSCQVRSPMKAYRFPLGRVTKTRTEPVVCPPASVTTPEPSPSMSRLDGKPRYGSRRTAAPAHPHVRARSYAQTEVDDPSAPPDLHYEDRGLDVGGARNFFERSSAGIGARPGPPASTQAAMEASVPSSAQPSQVGWPPRARPAEAGRTTRTSERSQGPRQSLTRTRARSLTGGAEAFEAGRVVDVRVLALGAAAATAADGDGRECGGHSATPPALRRSTSGPRRSPRASR